MPLPDTFVQSLQSMHPREVFEEFQRRPLQQLRSLIEIQNEVRPADLFCYLGARFGPPNGVQNFLRTDDSDNLIHWDWTLRHDAGVISFMGMNFRTEVHLFGLDAADDDRSRLIEQLTSDFPNHGSEMGKIRNALEDWTEFVNPYQRIRRSVERLLIDLDSLNLRADEDPCDPFADKGSPADTSKHWTELAQRYSRGFGLCFGIRSMLPVMAEAFVNLLLYVLMRSEIRTDQRLMENVFRQPIDVRIKSLSINCTGFKCQPDYSNSACVAYHRLVNERNDLLHGNVAIGKLKFNEVYFWGKVPVFKKYKSMWQRSLQIEADSVGMSTIRSELSTVDALKDYLLSCLEDEVCEKIRLIVERHELGFNEPSGKVGVLFPGWLVDMRLGPNVPDQSDTV